MRDFQRIFVSMQGYWENEREAFFKWPKGSRLKPFFDDNYRSVETILTNWQDRGHLNPLIAAMHSVTIFHD